MKKIYNWVLTLAMALPLALTSCTADDGPGDDSSLWQGSLENAPYFDDAASYIITDESSPYTSIELTASGLYFVTERNPYYFNSYSAPRLLKKAASRASESPILYGQFINKGDGSFSLGRLCECKWNPDTRTLTVIIAGTTYHWSAVKENNVASNRLNNRLCRTWKVDAVRVSFCDSRNKELSSQNLTAAQIKEEFVQYFTFTRAGNLYEYDYDDWYHFGWEWRNTSDQIMEITAYDLSDGDGLNQVYFKDNTMVMMQPEYIDGPEDASDYTKMGINVPLSTRLIKVYETCVPYNP